MNLSYTACSFVLKRRYAKNAEKRKDLYSEFIDKEADCKASDVLEAVELFCKRQNNLIDDEEAGRIYNARLVERGEVANINYMLIEIKSGVYGLAREIVDKDTKETSYYQSPSEASVLSFYLTIAIPKSIEGHSIYKGLMFFQNNGQYGVKVNTCRLLKKYFSNIFEYTMWVGTISPEIFVEKMLNSDSIKKIRFLRNVVSTDKADNLTFSYGQEERVIQRVFGWGRFKEKLSAFLSGNQRVFEFENKEYDNVKVEIDVGGRIRTIGLNNIENVSIIESLPNDLIKVDGKIDTNRLVKIILDSAEDYLNRIIYCE